MFPNRPPSLLPMKRALEMLGDSGQLDPDRVILVAGTNGKGSTSITLENLFTHVAHERVGLYTSPHLIDTTERIRIAARDLTQDEFTNVYFDCESIIEAENLSHFEALTLMAVRAFQKARLDRFIFEIGLGGTWDATNAIPHAVSVITSLALDHQNLLGSTIVEIAQNKFGIVQKHNRVFHAPLPQEICELKLEIERSTRSQWTERENFSFDTETTGEDPETFLTYQGQRAKINLQGERRAANSALALTTFLALRPTDSVNESLAALRNVFWPGRMEKFIAPWCPCPIYLSGDHNPHGVRSLVEILKQYRYRSVHFLVGIGVDKNADEMLQLFLGVPDSKVFLTQTPYKGRPVASYPSNLRARCEDACDNPSIALKRLTKLCGESDLIVVTGSLYLVGEIRKLLLSPTEDRT